MTRCLGHASIEIESGATVLSLAKLGAPPGEKARAGRANAEGESVLYLATDEATAIAEVPPWKEPRSP